MKNYLKSIYDVLYLILVFFQSLSVRESVAMFGTVHCRDEGNNC